MGDPTSSVLDVEDLATRVTAAIDGFVEAKVQVLERISPDLTSMAAALTELLSGGKRLRPAFCWWGWRAAGGNNSDAALIAASSLELLQASALIHDDVIDASDTRRGMPSVHRRFQAQHHSAHWHGSAKSFGMAAAILLGDACLAWVDEMYSESGLSGAVLDRGRPYLNLMKTEVMAGQFLDVLEQARGGGSVERALRVARYKSAKYTIERPLHLGGALAGAGSETLEAFTAYGLPLGEAFQLRDDILGIFGDPAETGKPAGDDLREGKRTVLIATAIDNATKEQANTINASLGNPHLRDAQITQLRDIIAATGSLAQAEALIEQRTTEALGALDRAPIDPAARATLADLATAATTRRS